MARHVVVCPEPLAAEAGAETFRRGGSAVDAALATAYAQCVVSPVMASIAGTGGMNVFHAPSGRHVVIDFLGRSGSLCTPDMYVGHPSAEQQRGYRSILVPSFVRVTQAAFEQFGSGRVSWASILEPAIRCVILAVLSVRVGSRRHVGLHSAPPDHDGARAARRLARGLLDAPLPAGRSGHDDADRAPGGVRPHGGRQLGPVVRRLLRQPGVVVGAVILLRLIVGAAFAPFLTPYEPAKMSSREALQPPSLLHPLGTDHFGRDQLARLLYGGSLSLQVGLVVVAIGASIGIMLGAIAGYKGGWIDEIIGRIIDVKLAFPGILLALGVVAVLGPDLMSLMIAVGVGTIPGFCRLVRGQVLAARELDYVLAAQTIGCQHVRIVTRRILPNVIAPVVVYGTLAIAGAILAGASLTYVGMGATPPTPEWELMLAESRDQIRRAWWLATFPGVAIMLTVISIDLLGDDLRDPFDPWLTSR